MISQTYAQFHTGDEPNAEIIIDSAVSYRDALRDVEFAKLAVTDVELRHANYQREMTIQLTIEALAKQVEEGK